MKLPLYFISVFSYFWIPVLIMGALLYPKQGRLTKKAFWLTLAIFYPLATGMEYVYLHLDIWTFSEEFDRLLGLSIFGAPVEEFVFWFGAPPFVLMTYFGFDRLFKRRKNIA